MAFSIQRKVAARLVPAWLILSIILGAFTYGMESGRVDDFAFDLATAAEFDTIKAHVSIGEDIVGESKWLAKARDVVIYHHEKYDGTGYLSGVKGDAIPFNARLFAIVDVFDALTSQRPYKPALPLDEALRLLADARGAHFDPDILDVFVPLAPDLLREFAAAGEAYLKARIAGFEMHYFPQSNALR